MRCSRATCADLCSNGSRRCSVGHASIGRRWQEHREIGDDEGHDYATAGGSCQHTLIKFRGGHRGNRKGEMPKSIRTAPEDSAEADLKAQWELNGWAWSLGLGAWGPVLGTIHTRHADGKVARGCRILGLLLALTQPVLHGEDDGGPATRGKSRRVSADFCLCTSASA